MTLLLVDLEPSWLRYEPRDGIVYHRHVDTIAEAQGIFFVCPGCFEAQGRHRPGVHGVICWSKTAGVPDEAMPGPGRWRLVGTGYHDLTLDSEPGKSRSVLLTPPGCQWHGFVTNGEVTTC